MLAPLARLETPGPTIKTAEALASVAELGFVLVDRDWPGQPPTSHLVVALRAAPTYAHFDPEWILYWAASGGRGRQARLDRTQPSGTRPFAWGTIRLFDRLSEFNTFVTFGGEFHVERPADGLVLVQFDSPAPILRWTGHSQTTDERAADVECFFARLMVPIDYTPGAEAIIAAASPTALYAAMLRDLDQRLHLQRASVASSTSVAKWVWHEAHRLQDADPASWAQGGAVLEAAGLIRRPAERCDDPVTPGGPARRDRPVD